jgi:hypothetical protein
MVSLNRLSPRYVLYSNHNNNTRVRNQKMLGQQQNMPKRKEMKTLVSRRSDEDPQPLRPLTIPTMLEALQSDQS